MKKSFKSNQVFRQSLRSKYYKFSKTTKLQAYFQEDLKRQFQVKNTANYILSVVKKALRKN